jgi:hypothetical protein
MGFRHKAQGCPALARKGGATLGAQPKRINAEGVAAFRMADAARNANNFVNGSIKLLTFAGQSDKQVVSIVLTDPSGQTTRFLPGRKPLDVIM